MQQQQILKLGDAPTGSLVMIKVDAHERTGRGFALVRKDRVMFVQLSPMDGDVRPGKWVEGISAPRPLPAASPMANLTGVVILTGLDEEHALDDLEEKAARAVMHSMITTELHENEIRFRVAGALLSDGVRWEGDNPPTTPGAVVGQSTAVREELVTWLVGQGLSATSHELQVLSALTSAGRTVVEPGRFMFWQGVPPGTLVRHRDHRYFRLPGPVAIGWQACFNGAWLDAGVTPDPRPWDGMGLLGETVEIVGVGLAEDTTIGLLRQVDDLHGIRLRLVRLAEEWPAMKGLDVEQLAVEFHAGGLRAVDIVPERIAPLLPRVDTPDIREVSVEAVQIIRVAHQPVPFERPEVSRVNLWPGSGLPPLLSEPTRFRVDPSDDASAMRAGAAGLFEARQLREAANDLLREVSGRSDVDPVVGLRQLLDSMRDR